MTARKQPLIALFVFVLLFIFFLGCSNYDDAQEEFERQAFQQPRNFTQTNANGQVISEDPDDWRISPMFQGLVRVLTPAFPNPTQNDQVFIELDIGIDEVRGIEVLTIQNAFGQNLFRELFADRRSPLPPGLLTITIDPVNLSPTNSYADAIGLHRVFIFDARRNLISYGDIMVE